MKFTRKLVGVVAVLALAAVGLTAVAQTAPAQKATAAVKAGARALGAAAVNTARQINANSEPGQWMSAGRTYDQQRYSPLTQINQSNVKNLGLAWYGDMDTVNAQEATPVIVDGVLYVTTNWSMVKAYNAKTGEKLWEYDPKVDRPKSGQVSCCGTVNRGVAAWNGKVYVAALDGRLIALNGRTGAVVWSVQTTDPDKPYTITGVPLVVKNKIIIGNGGAEYTCRGYVTAYDTETGRQIWRFYTVPDNPNDPNNKDPEILKRYAATWSGEWWKMGGGATAWDAILYDPKTDLVYFGTGNGLSWNQEIRSPQGGDNLFVSSIIALKADTGEYAWHYQSVPGDEWDYDVTNPLMTADIMVNGRMRHVLMQAPKIAFYYVWDAKTGELLSAEKFAPTNWAFSIDLKTGRPVENPAVRYDKDKAALVYPAALGAHNWHPMSFSPRTNLVYIPVTERAAAYQGQDPANFVLRDRAYNTGQTNTPQTTALLSAPGAPPRQGPSYLQAFNPTTGKEVWRVQNAVFGASGTMVTASDIVFSGNQAGEFVAYNARTGAKLWSAQAQARIQAAPATYMIDGEQYVAILAGSQGALPTGVQRTSASSVNNSRILVYKLGGTAQLPSAGVSTAANAPGGLNPPRETGTNEQVIDGDATFARLCVTCHGLAAVGGGSGPDLRYSRLLGNVTEWNNVVMGGSKVANGMPSFRGTIQPDDSVNLMHYVIRRANQGAQEMQAAGGRGGAPAGRGGPPGAAAPPARGGGRGG